MRFLTNILLANLLFWQPAFATLNSVDKQQLTHRNEIVNGGFENGLKGWVVSDAATLTKTVGTDMVGDVYGTFDANSAGDYIRTQALPVTYDLASKNAVGVCLVTVPSGTSTYKVSIFDGTNEIASRTDLISSTTGLPWVLNFIAPSAGAVQIEFEAVAADEPAIRIDDCFIARADKYNVGSVSVQDIFSAKSAAAGTVTDENFNWINGDCTNASPSVCTFNTGIFTVAPNCNVTLDSLTANTACTASSTSTTASIRCSNDSGVTITTSVAKIISCQKTGADATATQTAFTTDQSDFGWTSCTTTGAMTTNATWTCLYKRVGDTGHFRIRTSFSGATNGATTYSATLPNSLTIDTVKLLSTSTGLSSSNIGTCKHNGNTNAATGYATYTNSTSVGCTVIDEDSASNHYQTVVTTTAPTTIASGYFIEVDFQVPIVGWVNTNRAPQLVNSVVTKYSGVVGIESATVSSAGSVSQEYGDWISGSCTNANPMVCTLVTGVFSAPPNCSSTVAQTGTDSSCHATTTSATSVSITCNNAAGAASVQAVNKTLMCHGPR